MCFSTCAGTANSSPVRGGICLAQERKSWVGRERDRVLEGLHKFSGVKFATHKFLGFVAAGGNN